MTNETRWLIDMFKPLDFKYMFVTAFGQTPDGKRYWDDSDLKKAVDPVLRAYVGVSNRKYDVDKYLFIYGKKCDKPLEMDFKFNGVGYMSIPWNDLQRDDFDKFCKSLFIQLLIASSKGYAIKLGKRGDILLKPNTQYETMMECDLAAF